MRHAWLSVDVIFPLLTLLAAALVACDTGGSVTSSELRVQTTPNESASENDRDAEKLLAAGKTEARQWLDPKHENHLVWKWNKQAAMNAVNDLYRAGAKEVWVADVTKLERGGEMASNFVVLLPSDSGPRRKAFAWIARWEKDAEIDEEDLTKDTGQKYFVINTDQ